jgi:hypothetical protein
MEIPSFLKGNQLKTHAIALALGAIAAIVIGFNWGGWVRGSTARQMAQDKVNAEIVALYTPQCVKHFEAQANMPAHWAALKKAMSGYNERSFIEKTGFATLPGAKAANDDVADACARKLATVLDSMPAAKTAKIRS